jgi:uncharacterized membrane protein YhaH (DUF805 family)
MLVVLAVGLYSIRNGINYTVLNYVLVLLLAAFVLQFICAYRRLHDIGRTGIWALLIFAPYLSIPFFLYISYKAGDLSSNKYGTPDTRSVLTSILNKLDR